MKHVLAECKNIFFEKTKYNFYAFYIYWKYENIIIDSYLSIFINIWKYYSYSGY